MQKNPISSKILTENEALKRAAAICSKQECCVSEIEEKLTRWGQPSEAKERIIAQLRKERYIDESRYSRAYALDKLRYNHWGRVKIGQMLKMQGVTQSDRETALAELPDDEYREILIKVARQKQPSIKGNTEYERNGKLMRFMAGRGFELSLCREFLAMDEWEDD